MKFTTKLLLLLALSTLIFNCSSNEDALPIIDPTPTGLTVSTIAGGTAGNADGIGTEAKFFYPHGFNIDANGNLFVSDSGNDIIRKITPDGTVSTFAGGTEGAADGNGTNAQFNYPSGLCIDANGNLFVVDTQNQIIRKITPQGEVTTIAGTVGVSGYENGNGTNAKFNSPNGITIDANGNLYVADAYNHRIRKITPQGDVSTLAGSTNGFEDGIGSNAQFSQLLGINIDSSGNLYVADSGNDRIRKITPQGAVSTIAGSTNGYGDGIGENAKFNFPRGLVIHPNGNLYVSDTGNNKIRRINTENNVVTIVGSTQGSSDGTAAESKFNYPTELRIDSNGNLYVLDTNNHSIRKVTFN